MTKIWNAARFLQMNECAYAENFDSNSCQHTVNQWIVGQISLLTAQVVDTLDSYRFQIYPYKLKGQ